MNAEAVFNSIVRAVQRKPAFARKLVQNRAVVLALIAEAITTEERARAAERRRIADDQIAELFRVVREMRTDDEPHIDDLPSALADLRAQLGIANAQYVHAGGDPEALIHNLRMFDREAAATMKEREAREAARRPALPAPAPRAILEAERQLGPLSVLPSSSVFRDPVLIHRFLRGVHVAPRNQAWFLDAEATSQSDAEDVARRVAKGMHPRTKVDVTVPRLHDKPLLIGLADGSVFRVDSPVPVARKDEQGVPDTGVVKVSPTQWAIYLNGYLEGHERTKREAVAELERLQGRLGPRRPYDPMHPLARSTDADLRALSVVLREGPRSTSERQWVEGALRSLAREFDETRARLMRTTDEKATPENVAWNAARMPDILLSTARAGIHDAIRDEVVDGCERWGIECPAMFRRGSAIDTSTLGLFG